MEIIYIMIGISLLVALLFLAAFMWSVKSGQYDDDYSPAVRVLMDDAPPKGNSAAQKPSAKANQEEKKTNPKSII